MNWNYISLENTTAIVSDDTSDNAIKAMENPLEMVNYQT